MMHLKSVAKFRQYFLKLKYLTTSFCYSTTTGCTFGAEDRDYIKQA